MTQIGFVTAVEGAVGPAETCFTELWPNARLTVLYDQYLYRLHERENRLTDEMYERIRALLKLSEASGVEAIMFAGSLWGDCVRACRGDLAVPVLTAYESLIEEALSVGSPARIALLATVSGTISSFERDFERSCDGRIRLDSVYVDGAMDALAAGNRARHDELIISSALALNDADVVLLAQFSMESVAATVERLTSKRVLGSLSTAVSKLRRILVE